MTTKRFYTYQMIDPRDNMVFYVGKGSHYEHNVTRLRMRDHIYEAKGDPARWSNPHKCRKILEILHAGLKPLYDVEYFDTETSAYERECELIDRFGRSHMGGQLTNITEGGKAGHPMSRPVDAYNTNGEFVRQYSSVSAAAADIGLSAPNRLWDYLCGTSDASRIKTLKGYMFVYAGDPPPAPYKHSQKKRVFVKMKGNENMFESASEAAAHVGVAPSTMRNWCNGKFPQPSYVECGYV